jgi:MoaA/NifB/PqqE/SkfB family radical SAM enzyme
MPLNVKEWHWELTSQCNLNCLHCITDCGKPRANELPKGAALRAVRVMKKLGCKFLMITGGEPLCCPFLQDILQECRLRDVKVSFMTNGFSINGDFVNRCRGFVDSVGVSLDGSSADVNDRVRGRGSFEKACYAVSVFSGAFPTSVYVVASRNSINDIEGICRLAFSLGAVSVRVSEITMAGGAIEHGSLLALSEGNHRYLVDFAKEKTGVQDPITDCSVDLSSLYVSSEGLVYPCSEIAVRAPENSIGIIVGKDFLKSLRQDGILLAGTGKSCSYEVYAGNGFTFVLNSDATCPMLVRRLRND